MIRLVSSVAVLVAAPVYAMNGDGNGDKEPMQQAGETSGTDKTDEHSADHPTIGASGLAGDGKEFDATQEQKANWEALDNQPTSSVADAHMEGQAAAASGPTACGPEPVHAGRAEQPSDKNVAASPDADALKAASVSASARPEDILSASVEAGGADNPETSNRAAPTAPSQAVPNAGLEGGASSKPVSPRSAAVPQVAALPSLPVGGAPTAAATSASTNAHTAKTTPSSFSLEEHYASRLRKARISGDEADMKKAIQCMNATYPLGEKPASVQSEYSQTKAELKARESMTPLSANAPPGAGPSAAQLGGASSKSSGVPHHGAVPSHLPAGGAPTDPAAPSANAQPASTAGRAPSGSASRVGPVSRPSTPPGTPAAPAFAATPTSPTPAPPAAVRAAGAPESQSSNVFATSCLKCLGVSLVGGAGVGALGTGVFAWNKGRMPTIEDAKSLSGSFPSLAAIKGALFSAPAADDKAAPADDKKENAAPVDKDVAAAPTMFSAAFVTQAVTEASAPEDMTAEAAGSAFTEEEIKTESSFTQKHLLAAMLAAAGLVSAAALRRAKVNSDDDEEDGEDTDSEADA